MLMSLLSTLAVAITGYGYVLYQFPIMERNTAIVNLATIVACAVMALLYCVCIHIGAGQRIEQFITFNIRAKYYKGNECAYNSIFPKGYMPFGKTVFDFVQGIYSLLSKVVIIVIISILICSCYLADAKCITMLGIGLVFITICWLYRCYWYRKYCKRENLEYHARLDFLRDIGYTGEGKSFDCEQIKCGILTTFLCICAVVGIIILVNTISNDETLNIKPKVVQVQSSSAIDSVGMDYLIIVDEQLIKS